MPQDTFSPAPVRLMPSVPLSPTLEADALAQKLRRDGREVYHMGFGQAPFPAPQRLVDALNIHAHEKSYLPVAGLPELRQAVATHQQRLIGTDPEAVDVLIAPGSKLIIYAVQMAIEGDLLLPVPSWVSYAPQAAMLGQKVIPVATDLTPEGMLISGAALERTIQDARAAGQNPTKILLNYPSNPTGLTIPQEQLQDIAKVCVAHGVTIIADEIYGRLVFDGRYRSIARYAPDNTVVTSGLSKHLSIGGWRLGIGVVPKAITGLFEALTGIASETWSCVAAPIQMAAIEAYQGHEDIEEFVKDSTVIHAAVTRFVAEGLREIGIKCLDAQGGFYLWPDFGTVADHPTSEALSRDLMMQEGIVALPGTAFGAPPEALRLRLSTCDFDGAEALAFLRKAGGRLTPQDVPQFAPRVAAALDGFRRFVHAQHA
ncbi:aminotransferase class I/II-fold pyridoxal phosphate-dependent enzyme [Cognatishimia sp. SS12]|uniref:pyridoxal phosphate-dependent aminotransferase n=1 Tax=Cognatishimia sp. SS12 TaxID=2979465 RepID=UPI00232BE459|nr:aminotransferase class I/II-fold pyridoxal phosphate-dependent enzyme [Cognatishimia sp. SS12]MDC0737081.1 aminotransferase class I/II-fold pyridoxal phosphate-dependent enzyme [Cognatishimia sp. SS12]